MGILTWNQNWTFFCSLFSFPGIRLLQLSEMNLLNKYKVKKNGETRFTWHYHIIDFACATLGFSLIYSLKKHTLVKFSELNLHAYMCQESCFFLFRIISIWRVIFYQWSIQHCCQRSIQGSHTRARQKVSRYWTFLATKPKTLHYQP